MSTMNISISEDHVGLVLLSDHDGDSSFYLEIPLDSINANCLDAARYLLFVGWCILGVEGVLSLEPDGQERDSDDDIVEQEIYYYVRHEDVLQAIDLEVIRMRTNLSSETSRTTVRTRKNFCTKLLERDVSCVWTGAHEGSGLYIIPFRRGSEWLRLIVENRPPYAESVDDLNDINDIRNGVFAYAGIHCGFDSRRGVILKTPNPYLQPSDIPTRAIIRDLPHELSYPPDNRYTLQWLVPRDQFLTTTIPNNLDAAFKGCTMEPKPSDLLLHYNYGAAAVKLWGHGIEVLHNQFNPPRPSEPQAVPAPSGPLTAIGDRTTLATHEFSPAETGSAEEKLEGQAMMWDEDDVMLFFMRNTPAARDRHRRETQENAQRMERWRKGLSYV